MNKLITYTRRINIEMIAWPVGLFLLFQMDPSVQHLSLCPLKNMGFEYCLGCGLGHSIHYIFHGEFVKSFHAHPLGGFALIMLIYRTVYLISLAFKNFINRKYQL